MLSFNVFGVEDADEIDDERARELADEMYAALKDDGVDVDGVAPVLNDSDGGETDG